MIKMYAGIAIALAMFGFGWQTNSWYNDSKDLAIKKAEDAVLSAIRDKESEYAKTLEKNLARLKANERIIENHTEEIVNRPIYRNICIDADGLRILNSYALGNTAKLIGEMSEEANPGN